MTKKPPSTRQVEDSLSVRGAGVLARRVSRRTALRTVGGALAAPLILTKGYGVAQAAAPMLGKAHPTHYRFKLGKFEVTVLRDGATYPKGPYPAFGNDQFPEDVEALAIANHIPADRFELSYAPVMVNTGKELILFDTGNGAARGPGRGYLLKALRAAGYRPEQVDVVVLTHAHPDHIGGMISNDRAIFPNARYVVGEKEYDFWSPKELAEGGGGIARRATVVQQQLVPLAEKAAFVKHDGEIAGGIRAMDSPGHTPGHLAYHIESEGKRFLLWGDAIVHYVVSFQRPDWQLVADMDNDTAIASRERLLDMAAKDRLLVSGYHLPFPAVGFVEKLDQGYRYVPASYQLNL